LYKTHKVNYFDTGKVPVTPEETLEIFAFMAAADESKKRRGQKVRLDEMMDKAGKK
jgi:hypothetical protein